MHQSTQLALRRPSVGCGLTLRDFHELCDVWLLVETAAIDAHVDGPSVLADRQRRSHGADTALERHRRFHFDLVRTTRNPYFVEVIGETLEALEPYLQLCAAATPEALATAAIASGLQGSAGRTRSAFRAHVEAIARCIDELIED